jgi:alpha-glucoside transport system permease protein
VTTSAAEVATEARGAKAVSEGKRPGGGRHWLALAFLAPALVVVGAIVVYPTIDTFIQSFQNTERQFVGLDNFQRLAETERMITAIKNNAIWVATAPAIITGLGLMFAILTERVRYSTAIKVIVFMPMAISFLSTGVIWRLMYEQEPERGFVNAVIGGVSDAFGGPGLYPTARPSSEDDVSQEGGGAIAAREGVSPGETAVIGLTAIAPADTPGDAIQAVEPEVGSGELGVVVWRDFKPGGGEPGVVEQEELGLPDVAVQIRDASGEVVDTEETEADGSVVFTDLEGEGPFTPVVAASNFATGFRGVDWLGPSLVTPAIIGAFSWMWAGFAVVVIGAGLSALPRDVLEAARVDGANEWQTFRHVTLPLLAPVLGVVFITLAINVLKIFDIVLVLPPGASQDEANVIALEMWKTSFTDFEFGTGSAIAVILFVLVVPVMVLNIRRFRREM